MFLSARFGTRPDREVVLNLAQSLELVHTASLVHDDIVDDADLRRNVPTVAPETKGAFSLPATQTSTPLYRIARIEYDDASGDLREMPAAAEGMRGFTIRGSASYGLRAEMSEEATVWRFPVESISSSEGGLERVWQGASVSIVRALDLAPGQAVRFSIDWRVVDVKRVTLEE